MKNNKSKFWNKALLFSGVTIAIISLIIIITLTPKPKNKPDAQHSIGIKNSSSIIGGDFILTDMNGKLFDSKNLRGKMMLLYFGFTYCPDICPTSLHEMSLALDEIDDSKLLQALFISIDPERDTPAQLKEYFQGFDKRIIPLTGTKNTIAQIAKKFRVYYTKAKDNKESTSDYLINHSSFFYLIDKNGKLIKYYQPGVSGIEMGKDILNHQD